MVMDLMLSGVGTVDLMQAARWKNPALPDSTTDPGELLLHLAVRLTSVMGGQVSPPPPNGNVPN